MCRNNISSYAPLRSVTAQGSKSFNHLPVIPGKYKKNPQSCRNQKTTALQKSQNCGIPLILKS